MKNFIKILFAAALICACKTEKKQEVKTEKQEVKTITNKPVVSVFADAETNPVTINGDAADDACIWINPTDVMQSTIIATNKKEGLEVYTIDGELLKRYPVGKVNNVDIRYGFTLNNTTYPVVTASNRTTNSISIFIVKPDGTLEDVAARTITSTLEPVYGLGMYKSPKTNIMYVFMVDKKGAIEQWELFENNTKIDAKLVREITISSQGEGIVADDFYSKVYIGEENKALWKFDAEPNAKNEGEEIIKTEDKNMKSDFEGVTMYDSGNGEGYIILSSQGNNSYAVLDRVSNQYLGTFKIDNGTIDGTTDTDGIDVTAIAFSSKYPKGFFIAQDYENLQGKDTLPQNFKIVDWQKIANKLNLK